MTELQWETMRWQWECQQKDKDYDTEETYTKAEMKHEINEDKHIFGGSKY